MTILRAALAAAVAFSCIVGSLAAEAQSAKAPRVGLLGLGSAEGSPPFEGLRQGLRQQGWVEGQSIAFEDRSTVDSYNRLPDVALFVLAQALGQFRV